MEAVANPFLVNLWGTFQDDSNLYMVMDYVPGGELFSVLRKSKRFPDHVAKFYAAEVVLALEVRKADLTCIVSLRTYSNLSIVSTCKECRVS